jgi:hypothetical protein
MSMAAQRRSRAVVSSASLTFIGKVQPIITSLVALGRARRRFQRDQRTHAVPGQCRPPHTGGVEQCQQPVGAGLDVGAGRALAAAVCRQVDGQHAMAMVSEPARQQRPDAVVVQRAVHEHQAGQGGIEGLAAGVDLGRAPVDDAASCAPASRLLGRAQRFRSSIRSSASSRPMLSRIVPGVMPAPPAPRRPCGSAWCWPGG